MTYHPRFLIALCCGLLFISSGAGTEPTYFSRRNPIVQAVQKTRKSIVAVRIPRSGRKDSVGTGVIIDERGFILTNLHVVGSRRSTKVELYDNTKIDAQVFVREVSQDLAILRIRTNKKLTALRPAPVSDLMVGETVIAVGHPYGYSNTVSRGIISALGRTIQMPTGAVLKDLIQTDASINPGNSGGPLLNINGEFIGINVALREGAQGIAFTINAATVKSVLKKHLSAERIAGVRHGLSVEEKVVAETGDRSRVLVADCADEACPNLQRGDRIVAVGTCPVSNSFDVERALWNRRPGDKVTVKVERDGKQVALDLQLLPGSNHAAVAESRPRPSHDSARHYRTVHSN